MHAHHKVSGENARKLRKKGGAYLKKLRASSGLTQRELAEKTGFKYYTFISQIENGAGRIPPNLYEAYAAAVDVERSEFVKNMLKFYDPYTYKALFGPAPKKKAAKKKAA
ncbi:MAG: helix-turn-helix transcriptional regulator [Rhodospirillales bacterium]|jgi:transcriptional regulator with XRE-family HTH domain|nr:helix-turn-helix transcriptional regulator [Rhodospirillales bacterium]MBT3907037.1 helix-turn-helix transcriptional regulator [Rhodospirillaceae bacterium]MBT6221290.1 helix-turn-helix transcriptional regulator [Rhodospirillaceae bacterium]MBT6364257.1 helix-turn-helix transcriptional regulator [Rhodospirillaceae bacterium]MBT7488303.1 helix-turn-helix transcriptional regulator [Rhodospirillales bacterium]